ncbi:MAG: 50S ribosomal protein L4 [Verrucomicrobiia bacterium]
MSAKVLTLDQAAKTMKVEFIANGRGTQAVHDAVVALRANRRAGTHSVKTKATVQKSGSKPWRQKGTGRARAGYAASPVWRGGGVVFGPHPRDYSKKISKKTKKLALRKALGERIKNGDVNVVENFELTQPKTKELMGWLAQNKLKNSVLLIEAKANANLFLASRNVPKVETVLALDVNTEQLLRYNKIFISNEALTTLGQRLQ